MSIYVYRCLCRSIHVAIWISVSLSISISSPYQSICIFMFLIMCPYMNLYVYMSMYMFLYMYMYTHMYTHMYMNMYTYVYVYVRIYVHTSGCPKYVPRPEVGGANTVNPPDREGVFQARVVREVHAKLRALSGARGLRRARMSCCSAPICPGGVPEGVPASPTNVPAVPPPVSRFPSRRYPPHQVPVVSRLVFLWCLGVFVLCDRCCLCSCCWRVVIGRLSSMLAVLLVVV